MRNEINTLRLTFQTELKEALTSSAVEALQVKFLGRKGPIQELMKSLKDVSPDERPLLGKEVNDLKVEITETLVRTLRSLSEQEESNALKSEALDITLPGRRAFVGSKHLVIEVLDRILSILVEMGFSVQLGPDVETSYYNFEALNFPPDHPALDMQDTFYISPDVLLRTHTSNIQTRFMEANKPPIRIVAPGKAFRNETISARSHVFFHQVEGLYVDKNVSFADLLSTLEAFIKKLFHKDVELRFRPSYFPFVEPGLEVDIGCLVCKGRGCAVCKQTGWLEVLGAGMVHPEVLKNSGIDPEEYTGFAWGLGVERLVMQLHGINDIRILTENDMRFLMQFA